MLELSLEYTNKLASQSIFISALLCGFSLTILVLLLEQNDKSKLKTIIFRFSTIATCAFLICIFAMTKTLMMTTPGYPFEINNNDLVIPKLAGGLMFIVGIFSVVSIVSLSGWIKSKSMGRFTTGIGVVTLLFVLLFLS